MKRISVTERKGRGAHHQTGQETSRAALRFARVPQKKSEQSDAERIEKLRLQVQSGSYEVPAETLADDLIDAHREE